MSWEALGAFPAALAVFYGFQRANAEHAAAQSQYEQHKARVDNAIQVLAMLPPKARTSQAVKCHGCGSHEWRQHNNVRICAYCRSGQ